MLNMFSPAMLESTNQCKMTSKKVIWIGTSLPAGTGGGAWVDYPTQVGRALRINVVNEAEGSSRLTWNAANLEIYSSVKALSIAGTIADFTAESLATTHGYETKLIGKSPDYVVLDHSVNDTYEAVGVAGSSNKAEFCGALNYVYNAVKTNHPGTKFITLSPFSHLIINSALKPQIDAIVAGIASWSDGKADVVYIDVAAGLGLTQQQVIDLTDEAGIHPNATCTDMIADFLITKFKTVSL